jgi:hypothetical protein
MPERWQRELRRLREVNVAPSVLERARTGPRRELPPPRRQRAIAVIVAFAVFIAGGAFAWHALRPRPSAQPISSPTPPPPEAVVTVVLPEGERSPIDATLAYAGLQEEAVSGGYSVEEIRADGSGSSGHADAVAPTIERFLTVPPGTTVRVEGAAVTGASLLEPTTLNPVKRLSGFQDGTAVLSFEGGTGVFPTEAGRYALDLEVEQRLEGDGWTRTYTATFYFGIEITARTEASPTAEEIPDVAQVVCAADGTTEVLTPIVRPQSDGVHFQIQNDAGVGALAGHVPERSESNWAFEFERRASVASSLWPMDLEPDRYLVQCLTSVDSDVVAAGSDPGLEAPIEIRDVDGVWYPDSLSCDEAREDGGFPGGDVAVNPASLIEEVLRWGIPGILPSDAVTPAGYQEAERKEWDWRVVRGGEVVALIRIIGEASRPSRYLMMDACRNSGVGDKDLPTAGALATPYEMPDITRCDPYAEDCVPVYVSVARYAEARGEQPRDYGYDYRSENDPPYCPEMGPDGCVADPRAVPFTLLMTPSDVQAFIQANGCGATLHGLCR